MKLIDEKIVGEIEVKIRRDRIFENYNELQQSRTKKGYATWRKWEDLPRFATYWCQALNVGNPTEVVNFTACVASYGTPGIFSSIQRGMDRRHALKVLRDLGLNPPTIKQVIMLASSNFFLKQIIKISQASDYRRIMCVTGFNPESPEYFYFGLGIDRLGSFHQETYRTVDGEDNLYFWYHHTDEKGKVDLGTDIIYYHFPLLLGIRPS